MVGFGILDLLLREQTDYATGQIYPALSCCNDDDIAARCSDSRAKKCIWAIKGTAKFNSEAALGLREAFRQGTIRLLRSEYECDELLGDIKGWSKLDTATQMNIKMAYINTALLVNELINLDYESKDTGVKVREKAGMRKDRYSSLSYNLAVSRELERQLGRPKSRHVIDVVQFKRPNIKTFSR